MEQRRHRLAYWACCALATIQFVWIYLSRTKSGLDLVAYERGLERTPFQYRVLLMKPFQWAHGSALLQGWAERLSGFPACFPRGVGPEGIAEAALDVASVLAACWAGFALYRRTTRQRLLGWLVWPLTLILSLLTYAAATHHNLRFPYDLPGMAAFSVCLLLLYDGKNLPAFYAAFAAATLNRETSLLLLPFLVLRDRARSVRLGATVLACVPPLAFWAGLHLYLAHRFAGNGTAAGPRLLLNAGSLLIPFLWPQIFLRARLSLALSAFKSPVDTRSRAQKLACRVRGLAPLHDVFRPSRRAAHFRRAHSLDRLLACSDP